MSKERFIYSILEALKKVTGQKENKFIGLHEPYFNGNEWSYVKDCLDTRWVSSVGKYVDLFEKQLAEYTGAKKAVAVVNGTAALHICLKLIGVKRNDEVLVPALTFIATTNAISYCEAIPHFIDSEIQTLGVDPDKLDIYLNDITYMKDGRCYNKISHRCIKAVVPMHTFGHPVRMDRLVEVAQKYNMEIIEDAAESLGSYYQGRHTGNFGKIASLSFNGNKSITTGGGGAILTNDEELGKLAKHLTTTAKRPHKWEFYHDMVAYNYRLPNINAALGCAQMEELEGFLKKKRSLATSYKKAFDNIKGIRFIEEPNLSQSNYWLNAILLDEDKVIYRNDILTTTNEQNIMTRPAWILMHKLPMYQDCPKMDLSVSESIEARLINIPSSVFLGAD